MVVLRLGDLVRLGLAIMAVGRSIIRRSDTAEVPGLAEVFILAVPMKGYLRNGPGRPQIGGRLFGTPRRSARSLFRFAECRRQIPSYRVAPENPKKSHRLVDV